MITYRVAIGLVLLMPVAVQAITYEADGAAERNDFETITTGVNLQSIADTQDDITIFDKQERGILPSVVVDLTRMTVEQWDSEWVVTFITKEPLPEDPGMPINFDIFFDRDNNSQNNADYGVYRVGADTIAMILFGNRTKWHSKLWFYEPETGKWIEQDIPIDYTIGADQFSITIPYSVLPRDAKVPLRGFSLSSEDAITAIDVIPGNGLPALLINADGIETDHSTNVINNRSANWQTIVLTIAGMVIIGLIAIITGPFTFTRRS